MAVAREVARSLGAWLKAQIQNALIVTGLYLAAWALTGVPWWPLTGLVCGAVNAVPHLGPVLALGLGLLAKSAITGDWVPLAWVAGAWMAIQLIDGFLLSPRAAGRAGVHPFLSILLTLAGGLMFGPLGMLLAVPVSAVAIIVTRAVRAKPSGAR